MLLDLVVILDLVLDREPYSAPAAELLGILETRPGSAFIARHSISNFVYLSTGRRGRKTSRQFVADLCRFVAVAKTDTESLHYAAGLPMSDFEDAMQVAAAAACGADVIVTRNLRDYRRSPIRAAAPGDVIPELRQA